MIRFVCPMCQAKMKAPAEAAGRKARCPTCHNICKIPAAASDAAATAGPSATAAPAPGKKAVSTRAAAPSHGGEDDLLSGLAAGEALELSAPPAAIGSAPTLGASMSVRPCPSCGKALAGGTVLCTSCGYNLKSGRQEGGVAGAAAGALGGAVGGLVRAGSPLLIGTACSAAGALIGGAVWYGIIAATHYELRWIAWLVGGLAGLGMNIGFRDSSFVAGGIAAFFAVVAILAARWFAMDVVLSKTTDDMLKADDTPRFTLVSIIATENMRKRGFETVEDEPEPSSPQGKALAEEEDKAEKQVEGMSDDQVRREIKKRMDSMRSVLSGELYKSLFSPIDLVFFGLAIVTAFKVGACGFSTG